MGYMHIDNLYKNKDILLFKECYALEKIHGTSAHIKFTMSSFQELDMVFFPGGIKKETFEALFDKAELATLFAEVADKYQLNELTVYGEAYGGSCQKMAHTYGDKLRFIAFDVKVHDSWLDVPQAAETVQHLNLDFVFFVRTSTDIKMLDSERDRVSTQAIRNLGYQADPRQGEGVVLRPLVEMTKKNGKRIIAKHKAEKFGETKTPRVVSDEESKVLSDAREVAEEWVTGMRLEHVLDKLGNPSDLSAIPHIKNAMIEDIQREGEGEIEWSKSVGKAIGHRVVELFKGKVCKV